MSIIVILIPVSIVIAACFLAAFIWAVKSGQYDDTCTPSMRLLVEETAVGKLQRTPRPNPLPRAEGTAGGASLLLQRDSRESSCGHSREEQRTFLPLPEGKRWGKGERDSRTTTDVGSEPSVPNPVAATSAASTLSTQNPSQPS